jgi:hypothetical protein
VEKKRETYVYVLAVKGVYGRNRSVKFTTARLLQVDRNAPKTVSELMPLVTAKLTEMKVKPGAYVSLSEDPVDVETHTGSDGAEYQIETFMIFSGKKLYETRV